MKLTKRLVTTIAACFVVVLTLGFFTTGMFAQADSQGTFQIGYIGALSGPVASFGVPAFEGVQFAVDEINARGGVAGRPIEVVPYDDQGDPFRARQGVDRLAAQGIHFVVSGSSSAGALAQVPRAHALGVVMLTPLGSDPAITNQNLDYDGDPWFFANVPNNTVLGGSMAIYAARELGIRTVAVFVRDDAYGLTISEGFETYGSRDGITITRKVHYPVTAQDFSSDLAVVLAGRPDAIFLSGYAPDSGLIAKQARLFGFNGPLLGTNPLPSPEYREIAGDGARNTYASTALSVERLATDSGVDFLAKWQAAKGTEPNAYHMGAYDSVQLMIEGIENVGFDPAAVRSYLTTIEGYPGASGTITFNPDGSVTKPVFMAHLDGDSWKYVGTIDSLDD